MTEWSAGGVVVVGNPRPSSRTRQAAEAVLEALTGRPAASVIEVSDLGPGLVVGGAEAVAQAKRTVLAASLLIIASPTYKATYTGLLKLFLDQFAAGELHGIPTVALMLGAGPSHALAPEYTLKPLLSELGACLPTPALYLIDSTWSTAPDLERWLRVARPPLAALARGGESAPV